MKKPEPCAEHESKDPGAGSFSPDPCKRCGWSAEDHAKWHLNAKIEMLQAAKEQAEAKADALALQLAEAREELERVKHIARESGAAVERLADDADAAEATLTALRAGGHVQHTRKCAKSTRETTDGHVVALTPWEAEQQRCTCGLTDLLADGATDPAAREPESA